MCPTQRHNVTFVQVRGTCDEPCVGGSAPREGHRMSERDLYKFEP